MKIVAVGDLSFRDEEERDTKKTFQNIANQNPDLVIALGDLCYKKKLDPFLEATTNIGNEKFKPIVGNHDDDDDEKLNNEEAEEFWNQIKRTFDVDKPYYDFIKENIYFIILYTHTEFIRDQEQIRFVKEKLIEASSRPEIDWIIVCYHKPSVTSDTRGGHPPDKEFARIYHSLFDQYGVDLILTGHNHNYQRSKVVKNNPQDETKPIVISEGNNNEYDTSQGRIFIVVGSGGRDKERFDRDQEEYIKCRYHESYGILSIEVETRKKMRCKFISNDGKIVDTFTIDKSNAIISDNN